MQDRANPYSRERTIAISSQTTGVSPNEVVVAGADVLDPWATPAWDARRPIDVNNLLCKPR